MIQICKYLGTNAPTNTHRLLKIKQISKQGKFAEVEIRSMSGEPVFIGWVTPEYLSNYEYVDEV